eukprot:gene29649-38774_t
MRIFPRVIDISSESDEHYFYISNEDNDLATSFDANKRSHTQVLLFRIRRPEFKRLNFHPKKGVIEAGSTCQISIRMIANGQNNISNTISSTTKVALGQVSKLLVKAVVVNKAAISDDRRKGIKFDFEKYWLQGLEESGGREVRKIVDVIDSSLVHPKQSPQRWIEDEEEDYVGDFVVESLRSRLLQQSNEIFSESASIRMSKISSKVDDNRFVEHLRDDGYLDHDFSVAEPTLTEAGRSVSREEYYGNNNAIKSHSTLDIYYHKLKNDINFNGSTPSHQPSVEYPERGYERSVSITNESPNSNAVNRLTHELIVSADNCSRLVLLGGKSSNTSNGSVLVEVFGPSITDATLAPLLSRRLLECRQQHARVVSAIELMECNLSSLDHLLLRNDDFNWKESIKHLIVNNCAKLSVLSLSINSLHNLISLNLCGNDIKGLCYPSNNSNRDGGIRSLPLLDLPNLRILDLSHNRLQSLDFLQLLLELRTLLVSHNHISSLLLSVNTLVPLALHLTTLDLSNNPVCKDLRYAEEVLSVLPGLRYFDSIDMNTFGKTYQAIKSRVISNYSTQEQQRIGYSDRSESFLRSTASSRSRSESHTVRSRRYVSTAPEAIIPKGASPSLPEFPCVASPSPLGAVDDDVRSRDPALELKLMRSSVTSSPSRAISNNSRRAHSTGRSHGRKSKSTVEAPTQSALIRWQSFGIIPSQHGNDDASDDQSTAGSTSLHSRHETCRKPPFCVSAKVSREVFLEMQEGERHGIWQPRYQVPKPNFGFSKPFIERQQPTQKKYVPMFEKTVQRLQDAFQKLPCRGTFTRSSKGLPADFYPMDYTEAECYRRQGYFSQVIGNKAEDFGTERPRSASAPARRASLSPHRSRQYREATTELPSPMRRKSVDEASRSASPTTPNRMHRRGSGASSPTLSTKSGSNSLNNNNNNNNNNKESFPDTGDHRRAGSSLTSRIGEDTLFADLPFFDALMKGSQESISQSIFDMSSTASSIWPTHTGGGGLNSAATATHSNSNSNIRDRSLPASAWDAPFIRSAQASTTEGKHRFRYESSPAPSPSRQPSKSPPQKKEPEQEKQRDFVKDSVFIAPDDFYPAPSEYQHNPTMELPMSIAQSANAIGNDAPQYYQHTLSNPLEQLALVSSVVQETPHGNGHVSSQEFITINNNSNNSDVEQDVAMREYLVWLDSQHDSNVA